MNLMTLFEALRQRLRPTQYLDGTELPADPQPPYRARLSWPIDNGPAGMEVRSLDTVRGDLQVIYAVRCPCGRRWMGPRLERVSICPKCGRAVLVHIS